MTTQSTPRSKVLHLILWISQILLALMYLMAGSMKGTLPLEKLSASLPWVLTTPVLLVRFIGFSEVMGAIGLILPSLLRIQPRLTVWAALGLSLLQLFAMAFHVSRGETAMLGVNAFLLALSLLVAWGRWRKAPIESKA